MTIALSRRARPDERRAALIEAAARVLARNGVAGASVRSIAREAGVSPGLIGHYFAGVDALVAEVFAGLGETVDVALDVAIADAGRDPLARLVACVTASFTATLADADLLARWIAFWSLTRSNAEVARLHAAQYGAFRRRIAALLAACGLDGGAALREATALTALVDGLWLELCLSPDALPASEAASLARAAIDRIPGLARV